jgi:hypothetical protein
MARSVSKVWRCTLFRPFHAVRRSAARLNPCTGARNAMPYTLAAAAAACGVNKSTVLRAIKSGKISGTKDVSEWHVEPAELHRVYPPVADAAAGTDAMPRHATGDAAALAMVQQRTAQAEERLSELKAMLEDMPSDRDAWRDQAQRLTLPSPQPSLSWWRWLRSTG